MFIHTPPELRRFSVNSFAGTGKQKQPLFSPQFNFNTSWPFCSNSNGSYYPDSLIQQTMFCKTVIIQG